MNECKYVIVNGCAIVFSSALTHSNMVGMNDKVEGAGFVRFGIVEDEFYGGQKMIAKAYGRSASLNIDSREEVDSKIISYQIIGR